MGTRTVYTGDTCTDNGSRGAQAGCGVWHKEDDPRNIGERVPHKVQTNQTGDLMAVLLAVKRHDPGEDLRIISGSRYIIDGPTKNLRRWEQRRWVDISHGGLFKTIVAEARFRKNSLEGSAVKETWRNCLRDEEELPTNWPSARGVLVGILVTRPAGHIS